MIIVAIFCLISKVIFLSFYTSNKKDAPCPPPTQSVLRASLLFLLFNSFSAVKTILAPLIPTDDQLQLLHHLHLKLIHQSLQSRAIKCFLQNSSDLEMLLNLL